MTLAREEKEDGNEKQARPQTTIDKQMHLKSRAQIKGKNMIEQQGKALFMTLDRKSILMGR